MTPVKMAQTDKNRYASELVPIELLQQPIDFPIATKIFAKNVIIKAPMTEMISTYDLNLPLKSGLPTEALINLYDKWNAGGAAVMVTGPIALTTRDLEGTGNMVVAKEVDTPLRRDLFKRLASTATHGTLIFAQLLHPGRMAIKTSPEFKAVDMNKLSVDELKEIVERYVFAARFTKDCGFNGVEINVSMDFALAQLVAAESNQRTDQYGGSLANRTRILFDVINGIRDGIKDDDNFVVGLKLHSLNFEQQFEEKQFAEFCKRLDVTKLDYIVLSGGRYDSIRQRDTISKDPSRKSEAFFVEFVTTVRKNVKKAKTWLSGGFNAIDQMWEALYEGWANGIVLARALCAEPDLPRKLLNGDVSAAKKPLLDSEFAAGTQLWQLAYNKNVLDLTNAAHVKKFEEELRSHQLEKVANSDPNNYSYPKFDI